MSPQLQHKPGISCPLQSEHRDHITPFLFFDTFCASFSHLFSIFPAAQGCFLCFLDLLSPLTCSQPPQNAGSRTGNDSAFGTFPFILRHFSLYSVCDPLSFPVIFSCRTAASLDSLRCEDFGCHSFMQHFSLILTFPS